MRLYACIGMILVIWAGVFGGCGYQLAGSGELPRGIVTIFVSEPVNQTSESQLISIISNELKSEMTRRQVQIANSPEEADGILESEIIFIADRTIVRRGVTTALEKRIEIRMDLKLQKPDGQTVWQGKGISANETYAVFGGDDLVTNGNRQVAISMLAQRLAEDVYNRLSADF